jgi:hypothetical protein
MSQRESSAEYQKVVQLFEDWRVFEEPVKTNDAPDYSTAARDAQFAKLGAYRDRADAIDIEALTRSERVDLEIIRCEMNGYEYYHRFFRPWERDPGYYQLVRYGGNDIPGWHVAHLHNVLIPSWLEFPLDSEAYAKLSQQLSGIPHLVAQAKENLVGDHKDLYAIAQSAHEWSIGELTTLADALKEHHPELVEKADACVVAAKDLLAWTKKRHDEMDDCGSGIGIEAFNWSMKHHHRVPYDWHQQEELLQRELDRAWATLALEEHRNRNVEPLAAPVTPKEGARRRVAAEAELIRVLRDMGVTELADWMSETWSVAPELYPTTPLEDYSFFHHVDLRGWLALRPHQVHFFDLYKEKINTHPIRKHTPLYQTWLFRCEGFATAFEELLMRAGLEDGTPRTRELVHICAAFRAARALAIHRVHGKGWTLEQAFDFAVKYTPRGWIKRDEGLLYADLTTYLRQPEYGVSYNVGKVQVDRLLATRAEQLGDKFNLGDFFNEYFACGLIPASLIRWEMTGEEDELKQMGAL